MLGDIQVESNPTPTNRIKSDIHTKPEKYYTKIKLHRNPT